MLKHVYARVYTCVSAYVCARGSESAKQMRTHRCSHNWAHVCMWHAARLTLAISAVQRM